MKTSQKLLFCILLSFVLSACVNLRHRPVPLAGMDPARFNQLHTGMAKEDVLQILGVPMTTAHSLGAELLHYQCIEKNAYGRPILIGYGVLLRDNKVIAFGRDIGFGDDQGL